MATIPNTYVGAILNQIAKLTQEHKLTIDPITFELLLDDNGVVAEYGKQKITITFTPSDLVVNGQDVKL